MPLTFTESGHRYELDGVALRSVTQILGDAALVELPRHADQRLKRKRILGRVVHSACCLLDEDDLDWDSLDPDAVPYVQAYQQFVSGPRVQVLDSEQMVLIDVQGIKIAGRFDRKMLINGEPYIIDLKTPDVAQPHWAIQIAGYVLGSPPPRRAPWRWKRAALMLGRDGRPRLIQYTDPVDFDVFRAAVIDPFHPALLTWKRNNSLSIEEEDT